MPTLFVMQGAPGSGKSFIAETIRFSLTKRGEKVIICSTDDLFYENGVYNFRPSLLGHFHAENLKTACHAMDAGWNVIVDNTNIHKAHVKSYIDYAKKEGYSIQIVRVQGCFKNTHGVPDDVVARMQANMEDLSELVGEFPYNPLPQKGN